MPYLLLAIGLVLAVYVLYRFFMRASLAEMKAFLLAALSFVIIIAVFVLAVTGRLPAALALVAALLPFVPKFYKADKDSAASPNLNRAEALEILGLEEDASAEDIRAAYKKLMKKVHPDQEGSQWMAQKLNAAKDLLLHN